MSPFSHMRGHKRVPTYVLVSSCRDATFSVGLWASDDWGRRTQALPFPDSLVAAERTYAISAARQPLVKFGMISAVVDQHAVNTLFDDMRFQPALPFIQDLDTVAKNQRSSRHENV